ncbi:hypothetical protein TdN_17880 [Thermodesulfovibrio sp. TK110]
MSKEDVKAFYEELLIIKRIDDFEKAVARFEELCKRFEKKYPAYIRNLLAKKEQYFQYLKYPEKVRKHIYTTNIVENINNFLCSFSVHLPFYKMKAEVKQISKERR